MTSSLRARALSGAKWNSLSVVFSVLCQFLQTVVLARLLEPKDFGLMAMVMVVVGFANLFADMGIGNAIIYRQDANRKELSSLYWLTLFSGIIPFVATVLGAPLVARFYSEPEVSGFLYWGALMFLITPFGQQFQLLLQKHLLFQTLAKVQMLSMACGFFVSVAAALLGQGVYSLILGQLVVSAVRSAHYMFIGWHKWPPQLHFHLKDIKGYLSFGMFQVGERSVNYMAWQLDKVLIGSLLGSEALGYYNIAYQLVLRPFQVFNPILTKVAFPTFAIIQDDDLRLRASYLKLVRTIALLLMPVYTLMILAGDLFFRTFLGENWDAAVPLFQILSILGYFYSLGNPISSLMLAKGRADLGFYQNVIVFLTYGSGVWVGSRFGLDGVAWSLVITTAILLFPMGFIIRRFLIGMTTMEFLSAFVPFLFASWIAGGMMAILRFEVHFLQSGVVALSIITLLFAVTYFGVIFVIKRAFLRELFSMLRTS